MKILLLAAVSLLTTVSGFAQGNFPGLKEILTESEWKRSGLNRLAPDELEVLEAALNRYHALAFKHESDREATAAATVTTPAMKNSVLERFGLPTFDRTDWRNLPPLRAKVATVISPIRFKLDNGQIWEGFEPLPVDLTGKPIEIRARANSQFALSVEGQNTTVRVMRLR